MRLGPARRGRPKGEPDSGTDHWAEGGVTYQSDFEENDADLAEYLKSNANFFGQMTATSGFTETWRIDIERVCLCLECSIQIQKNDFYIYIYIVD